MTQITLRDRLYSLVFETAEIEDNLITNIDRVVDAVLDEMRTTDPAMDEAGYAAMPERYGESVGVPSEIFAAMIDAASSTDPEDLRSPTPPSAQDTTRAKP